MSAKIQIVDGPRTLTDKSVLQALTRHGFKWIKDNCTDRVDADAILSISPSEGGFTVHYADGGALVKTVAVFDKIEIPADPESHWILVHWNELDDTRRPGH